MRLIPMLCLWLALATAVVAAAGETGFWGQLTPEERRAAGLDRLTPEQQAELDRLAGRYAGTRAGQAREETKRELKVQEQQREEARVGLTEESKTAVIRTRITGRFNGWSGRTIFRLENGQTWVQTNGDDRVWLSTLENPEVEIYPAGLGGWKLRLVGTGYWLHVRRVK
ncbi:MAG: hypothetical protein WC485_03190 [Opitutaceae bacterium]